MAQLSALSRAEMDAHELLLSCEQKVDTGLEDGAKALRQIFDQKLYKANGYLDFPVYCEQRWGWSKSYAYRLMDYSKVVDRLREEGHDFIPSPGQMKPALEMKRTCKDEDDFIQKAANAVTIAIDLAPKKNDVPQFTAKHTAGAMAQLGVYGRKSPKPKTDPAVDELKDLFKRLRNTTLYEVGDAEKFIKKHGIDGFPEDFTDMVDLLNECASLIVR